MSEEEPTWEEIKKRLAKLPAFGRCQKCGWAGMVQVEWECPRCSNASSDPKPDAD